MAKYVVGTIDEFKPGTRKIVELEGRSIGIFQLQGQFYALRNTCPHQGAPLCEGLVTPYVTSTNPYCFEYEKEEGILRCPWHQWEFDIQTGYMIVDHKLKTKTYEVSVEKYEINLQDAQVIVTI